MVVSFSSRLNKISFLKLPLEQKVVKYPENMSVGVFHPSSQGILYWTNDKRRLHGLFALIVYVDKLFNIYRILTQDGTQRTEVHLNSYGHVQRI